MGRDRMRVLACGLAAIALIIAGALAMDWYRLVFEPAAGGAMRITIDLRTFHICQLDTCTTSSLAPLPGMFPTLATVVLGASLLVAALVAYQAGARILSGNAYDPLTKLGYMISLMAISIAVAAAYLFGPESETSIAGAAAQAGIALHRTWGPATLIAGLAAGFATLYMTVSPDSSDHTAAYKPVAFVPPRATSENRTRVSSMPRPSTRIPFPEHTGLFPLPGREAAGTHAAGERAALGTTPLPRPDRPVAEAKLELVRERPTVDLRAPRPQSASGIALGREQTITGVLPARAATGSQPISVRPSTGSGAAPTSSASPTSPASPTSTTAEAPARARESTGIQPIRARPPAATLPIRERAATGVHPIMTLPADSQPPLRERAATGVHPVMELSEAGEVRAQTGTDTHAARERTGTGTHVARERTGTGTHVVRERTRVTSTGGAGPRPAAPPNGGAVPSTPPPASGPVAAGPTVTRARTASIAPAPEHLRDRLSYVAITAELTGGGIDARREDGSSRLVLWRDVVGVVARRLPPAYDGTLFVDVVSSAGSTLRIVPWTRLTGEPIATGLDERPRGIIERVTAKCPGAKLDPATRQFLETGEAAQLPDLDTLRAHDARLA